MGCTMGALRGGFRGPLGGTLRGLKGSGAALSIFQKGFLDSFGVSPPSCAGRTRAFWPGSSLNTSLSEKEKRRRPPPKEKIFFGELSWPQRKTFQAGGYKNPIKTKKTISTTEIFALWPSFFRQRKVPHWSRAVYAFFFPACNDVSFCPTSFSRNSWSNLGPQYPR